jgi:type I site-specific restriction-modification system R (restriction) subunit
MIVLLLFKINKLVNVGRNKPQVVDEIKVKGTHNSREHNRIDLVLVQQI